jgi:vancomycin resistance protein YoaR
MRFRNDTGGPIYVQTFLSGGRFHARLFSATAPRHNVEVESVTLSRSRGTRSAAYRIFKTSNGQRRQLLSRDYYKPKP